MRSDDMDQIFAGLDPELLRTNTPDVIATMMDTIRKHQVHLKGIVSTVVVSGSKSLPLLLFCGGGMVVLLLPLLHRWPTAPPA